MAKYIIFDDRNRVERTILDYSQIEASNCSKLKPIVYEMRSEEDKEREGSRERNMATTRGIVYLVSYQPLSIPCGYPI